MVKRYVTLLTLSASLTAASLMVASLPSVTAETIGISYQGEASKNVDRPLVGQTMQAVESRFGSPIAVRGPVGTPPITLWDYPGYTVYFEYNHVIHTVFKPVQ
jgi:hypothetical protein